MSKSSPNLQLTACSLDSCQESFADSDALAAQLAAPTKSGSFRSLVCKLSAGLGKHSPDRFSFADICAPVQTQLMAPHRSLPGSNPLYSPNNLPNCLIASVNIFPRRCEGELECELECASGYMSFHAGPPTDLVSACDVIGTYTQLASNWFCPVE